MNGQRKQEEKGDRYGGGVGEGLKDTWRPGRSGSDFKYLIGGSEVRNQAFVQDERENGKNFSIGGNE